MNGKQWDHCLPNIKRSRWKSAEVFEFGIRALEAVRGETFAEIPRFCKLIIFRVQF